MINQLKIYVVKGKTVSMRTAMAGTHSTARCPYMRKTLLVSDGKAVELLKLKPGSTCEACR